MAGGETSGAVVQGLEADRLAICPRLAPGVPLLRLPGDRPMGEAVRGLAGQRSSLPITVR